jgi:DNA-binding HxlR family transcriptional regulator
VATTLQALVAPSRLLILTELRQGPRRVTELADAVGMEQSAASHQLRLLRKPRPGHRHPYRAQHRLQPAPRRITRAFR